MLRRYNRLFLDVTYRCVYLHDSSCKRIFVFITQLVPNNSSNFTSYNVFKIAFVLFCFVSESVRLWLARMTSELRLSIKCVRLLSSFFCLQIHALAECTMNSKFCILHSAPAASCIIQNFSFIVHSARAVICKQDTHNSL